MGLFSFIILIPISCVEAASNPNLYVSAENTKFSNHFSGSMVVEVVIRDPNIHDTDNGKGEPDVTLNGKSLRMVQASDGNWYAYFANADKAKIADSTVGLSGEGLDFGVFCSRDTPSSVFGISLSETDGFAVPNSSLTSFTNGNSSFLSCDGIPDASNINNVVRNPRSINTNPNVPPGQIGLNPNAWPLIQLFSFKDVTIQYNAGGGSQKVNLDYDEIPNISLTTDRNSYPQNSEVFLTVNDFQLNQDPTDEDSWTFNIDSPLASFYNAFDKNGSDSANGNQGLINLIPFLSRLGFENNGYVSMGLQNVIELKSNNEQPSTSVNDGIGGNTYQKIITLVESGPNSGIFDSGDYNDESSIMILNDAPRGVAGNIEYNDNSISVLTGFSTASVSVTEPVLTIGDNIRSLKPGTKYPVVLVDSDQNVNSGSKDQLDVFRDSAIIPSLKIGNPVTLEQASNVKFYTSSSDPLTGSSKSIESSIFDKNSARLGIVTNSNSNGGFEKISFNLGVHASTLMTSLINTSTNNQYGTNWINLDLRSFENDFNIQNFDDTTISLFFGSLSDPSPITIIDSGDLKKSKDLIQLDDSDVKDFSSKTGNVFVVINFDSSNDSSNIGSVLDEKNHQPIILDFFSFGLFNNKDINNAIYRFELKESSDNSSKFEGTLEFSVANQINILDPAFIKTIKPIDKEVKFIVTNRLTDENGISISYSDLDKVGVITTTSTKSDIFTNSGTVTIDSPSYRFGQPVTITLKDPDLNLKNDNIDIYTVINDPFSPNVDTVGNNGILLLEVLIKDIRYKRCTISGVEYGGLGSTGFSLIETGSSTGIFEGVFKMPSQICDKTGRNLISSAGGGIDVKYYDSRDGSGNSNVFGMSKETTPQSVVSDPQLSAKNITIPSSGNTEEIYLSGRITSPQFGLPLEIILRQPGGVAQNFSAKLTNNGSYRASFSINENSFPGIYQIQLSHNNKEIGTVSFTVLNGDILEQTKKNAGLWSKDSIPDSLFLNGLEQMIKEKIIQSSSNENNSMTDNEIPLWLKNSARWWSNNQISDIEFINLVEYLAKKGIIRI